MVDCGCGVVTYDEDVTSSLLTDDQTEELYHDTDVEAGVEYGVDEYADETGTVLFVLAYSGEAGAMYSGAPLYSPISWFSSPFWYSSRATFALGSVHRILSGVTGVVPTTTGLAYVKSSDFCFLSAVVYVALHWICFKLEVGFAETILRPHTCG